MDMTDAEFAVTASPEVFQKYEVKSDTVVLFKKVWTLNDADREAENQ